VGGTKVARKHFDSIFMVEHLCPEYGVSIVPRKVNKPIPDYMFQLSIRPYEI